MPSNLPGIMNVVGDLPIEGPAPATSILISGPPRTGKFELLLRLLAEYTDSVIFISTENPADGVIKDYRAVVGDAFDGEIGVIDCVNRPDPAPDVENTDLIRYVQPPLNLTRIGVQFTDLMGVFHVPDAGGHVGVGVHSLSPLLADTSVRLVYQFLQVFTGQIRTAGWFGVSVIDPTDGDADEAQMLHDHFDGVIETRQHEDGHRELRVRGLAPRTSDWRSF